MARSRISHKKCKSKGKNYRKSHRRSGKYRRATCVSRRKSSRRRRSIHKSGRKSTRRRSVRRRRSSRSKQQEYSLTAPISSPPKPFLFPALTGPSSFPALGYQEDTRLI